MRNPAHAFMAVVSAIFVASMVALACTARERAKDVYDLKSHACLEAYDDEAHRRSCLEFVRAQYDEAGAPKATDLDGGSHE